MGCLMFLQLLTETLKKSKRAGKHSGKLPVRYEILSLSLKKKMASEVFSAKTHNLQSAGTTAVSPPEENSLGSVTQPLSPATTPTTQHNILNNNPAKPSAVSAAHPTLRER